MKALHSELPKPEKAWLPPLLDKVPLTPAEEAAPAETVCVTGATGYVGGAVVRRLLRAGHTVHCPVRRPDDLRKVGFLLSMPGASERLKLFKADLMVEGSYDEAIAGCSAVHHVASPWFMTGSKAMKEDKLIAPAVKGTENLLASCSKAPSVKKVILTGTIYNVAASLRNKDGSKVNVATKPNFDEGDYAIDDGCSPTNFPYVYSKCVQEQRAFEIAEAQSQYVLVNLCIGGTFGPPCSSRAEGASALAMKYIRGGIFFPVAPPIEFGMNDVRDVAAFHSMAQISPSAKGRYVCTERPVSFVELAGSLRKKWATFKFMTPYAKAPWAMKAPFRFLFPSLGFDRALVNRFWGIKSPGYDTTKIETDLDFAGQGFKWSQPTSYMVDMDLAYQKFGIWSTSTTISKRTIDGK